MKKRLPALLCVLALAFTLIGCGGAETYTVSGTVTLNGGSASVTDVRLTFNGVGETKPNADGTWSKSGLSGQVTIKPILKYYSFRPETYEVEGTEVNIVFVGTHVSHM